MADTIEIKVPDIGDFDKVPIIEVLVSEGDEVAEEDSLVTLESDKATMEVPSSTAGTIRKLHVAVGDEVSTGDIIATLEPAASEQSPSERDDDSAEQTATEAADAAESDDATEAREQEAQRSDEQPAESGTPTAAADAGASKPEIPESVDAGAGATGERPPHASPSVRKLARKLDIDIEQVRATGRKGRITEDDLHEHIKSRMAGGGIGLPERPRIDFSKFGEIEHRPLARIQRKSGRHLHRNWLTIPHVTQHDQADITELEAFRQAHSGEAEARGARLSLVAFLIQASAKALQRFPQFNASLSHDGDELIIKHYYHIGVAVDTEHGLVVPVIRDADRKGLLALSVELGELSSLARAGKLKPEQMQGGCFSISSLGGIGGTAFTPIVNGPEVAILGVSRSSRQPLWDDAQQQFTPRQMLPLSLSYDHRVIDGADAARFTRYLAECLSDLRRLLL